MIRKKTVYEEEIQCLHPIKKVSNIYCTIYIVNMLRDVFQSIMNRLYNMV